MVFNILKRRKTIKRIGFLLFAFATCAQMSRAQNAPDLRVELRSAIGSNRFQVGDVIPLELVFSSSAPHKYLEPCLPQLHRSCFGYPVCRFANHWKFSIAPEEGWVDLDKPCGAMSGPTFVVADLDLTPQLTIIPYELTERFRFDLPGKYTVTFSTDIGLDDDSNPRPELFKAMKETPERHSVNVKAEFQFEVIPADPEWQKEAIRSGYEAYSGKEPQPTNPPLAELAQYKKDTTGLCNLGTPEAARVLAELLLRGHFEVRPCLQRLPNTDAAVQEMERLLIDPDAAISPAFFTELVVLRNPANPKPLGFDYVLQDNADLERKRLIASLPHKQGEALSLSLLAVLSNPPASQRSPSEWSSYALPFPDPVLALTAANFEHFPRDAQNGLLTNSWDLIRSKRMLPVVQRLAEGGDGLALLRWQELDPAAANAFARAEIIRPVPRFSSFYLRLPQPLLPADEEQLASNFIKLAGQYDPRGYNDGLVRVATLLHRYGSRSILSRVLPVINADWNRWSCTMAYPALAYLLKVSPEDAAPKLEEATRHPQGPCTTSTFFTDLGTLEPSPILERLAFSQLADQPGPFARNAIDYLWRYASASAKEHVWERLEYWQRRRAALKLPSSPETPAAQEQQTQSIVTSLVDAFERAQGWLLTPQDETRLLSLLGGDEIKSVACRFQCGANLSVAAPANFAINDRKTQLDYQLPPILDYLQPTSPHRYLINQYVCPNMQALKNKLLQFPTGSSFDFAWDFSARDRDELVQISDFLWHHGYTVKNPQKWDFLRADPPR
jgi:hypothetical protein